MVVRLGSATCAAVIMFACSSSSVSLIGIQKQLTPRPVAGGPTIVGVASTYNPYRNDRRSGGAETASGEPYDPKTWTAAIQTDLRERFGGVRFGRDYHPAYALVACADKQAIVKINDVGPLEPGRVIDLSEQAMRYFDPTLELGLIPLIKITPLLGDDWAPGPITSDT
jgi:peptidoglycan lytic transglycosylase